MLRILPVIVVTATVLAARPSHACVQLPEANKLLGWSEDGKLALHARLEGTGELSFAEIHPTRYEGWKFIIMHSQGAIVVKKVAITSCEVLVAPEIERVPGKLTQQTLNELTIIKDLKLVPAVTGGVANDLRARFIPQKRFAEHKLEIRDAKRVVDTLTVPVWCMGSCLRDEKWTTWGASILAVTQAQDRKLYVVRMRRVCNGGNDHDMWIDRVIAVPASETPPAHGRCRGAG